MKYAFKILPFLCFLVITTCGKQIAEPVDTATVNLSFRATYGDEPLVLNEQQVYDYEGKGIKFSTLSFYLADLAAVNDDGETALSAIQFINLTSTHSTSSDALKGTIINFDKVPVGAYKYLKLGIGVPSDLNRTTPLDYAENHPLGATNNREYSADSGSYIFAKIEGQYDKDGDGFNDNDLVFSYNASGQNDLYVPLEFEHTFTLNAGETTNLGFELDVRQLLTRPFGSLIPIIDYDPNDQNEEGKIIMDNFIFALQLK